jgi:flavodoxin
LFNVSPQTLGDKFFSFNGATDSWVQEASSTVMGAGIGYIIRGPQSFMAPSPPSFYQATFIGVPNNGTISIPIGTSGESSYLLGNPYPSALDGETFIKNNSILDGTLYFWTHGTKIGTGTSNLGSGLYAYTSDDYASFNLTGGAAASSGGAIPTGKIGSGQGFFVTTVASGSVNFANTMRVGVGGIIGNNSQFFKTQPSAKTTALEKNRLWLDFFNEEGAFKQALIGYVSGASNDLDMQYDGESFDANEYVDFYSILNNKNLVIQGRAVPFDQEDKVILGFKTTIEGEFTIKIKQFDGLFDTQDVFIEDKLLKIKHDLKKEGYTFTTAKGTFDDRFVLFYANAKGITTTTDLDVVAKLVYVSTTNKDIKIASSTANIEAVKIFDVSGKEVFNKQKINSTDLSIRTLRQGNTVYVVKIKLDNGQTLTQKVIY